MPKEHLLIISEGFAPWGGPAAMRATKLAGCGLRRGLRVSVLTTATECAHVSDDHELLAEIVDAEVFRVSNGTDYRWRNAIGGTFGYKAARVADRLFAKSPEQWSEVCVNKALSRWDSCRPDVVYCTPPTTVVASIAKRLSEAWEAPWITDFRDPPWEIGLSSGEFERMLSECDKVVLNTTVAADRVYREYPDHVEKVECWPNGVDDVPQDFDGEVRTNPPYRPTLLYAGGLYPEIVGVADVLHSFVDKGKCQFAVFGFKELKRRRQLARLRMLGVTCRPPVTSRRMLPLLQDADAVVVVLPYGYWERIPLKTYLAVRSGRPVIVFGNSEATQSSLRDIDGVYFLPLRPAAEGVSAVLEKIAEYDPVAGWPGRYRWLCTKTWPNIFDGIFGRYL